MDRLALDDETPLTSLSRVIVLQGWQNSYGQRSNQSMERRAKVICASLSQQMRLFSREERSFRVTYYEGYPNTILSSSIEVIHASEWIGTPSDFKTSRPPSKVFSINAPMPTIFDPEASASRAKPKIVGPLARKSAMINTVSPFARYSGETINSTIRPLV